MAKHGKRRRKMGRYLPGQADEEMAVGTLTTKNVIKADFDQSVVERTRVSSLDAIWSLRNVTPTSNVGPLLVGIAHSDYTDAEIEEWIENIGAWSEADKVGQEVANRLIRKVGIFDVPGTVLEIVTLEEGIKIKTKLNWILTTGQTLAVWGYNLGTASYGATDPLVSVQGIVNLWPQ